jgi:UDP-glucose 4-epimerase
MRIFITGGTGFIGSHLAEALQRSGHDLLVIDNYETSRRDTLTTRLERLRVIEGDIADLSITGAAISQFAPDVVVHCAASYKDGEAWAADTRTNVLGTINVVRAARDAGVKRFIYFQTALCYGNHPVEQPVTLASPLKPETSYAISKTAGEHYIAMSGLEFQSFRLANIYGPRNLSGPIPTFYRRLKEGKPCFVVNTRRDYVYIDDLVQALTAAVTGRGSPGCYHLSTGRDFSIRELYDAVCAGLGIVRPPEERQRGDDDAPTILLDPSRIQQEFGWQATTPLREGIRRAVAWYDAHGVDQTFTHLKMQD